MLGRITDCFVGLIVLTAAAGGLRLALDLPLGVVPLAVVAYLAMCIALNADRERVSITLADRVTLGRALLVMLLIGLWPAYAAFMHDSRVIFALAFVAVIFDGVDGYVARRWHCATPAGARFDMELDALLLLVLGVWLVALERTGVWVLLIGAWRYGFVAAGWIWPWLRQPLAPSQRRRVICALQGLGLSAGLAPGMPSELVSVFALILLILLSVSFILDIRALGQTSTA